MDELFDYLSFCFMGVVWLAYIVFVPIFMICDSGALLEDVTFARNAYFVCLAIALALAAWEDFRLGTRHVVILAVIALFMTLLLSTFIKAGAVALVTIFLLLVIVIALGPGTAVIIGLVASWLGVGAVLLLLVTALCAVFGGFLLGF